jgi:hypothetical protein
MFFFMFLTLGWGIWKRYLAEDAPGWNITMNQWLTMGGKVGAVLGAATLLLLLLAYTIP